LTVHVAPGVALTVTLSLAVAGCSSADVSAGPGEAEPSAPPPVPTFEVTAAPGTAAPSEVRDQRPTRVRLPGDQTVPVRPAGTGRSGLLQVPRNIRVAGWWDGGARFGDAYGAMVIAGHVDSVSQGVGPFAQLLDVRPGDRVDVGAGSRWQRFAVTAVDLVPKVSLELRAGLFSPSGPLRLVLITCAGRYDPDRGGYQDLAVVTARPTGR